MTIKVDELYEHISAVSVHGFSMALSSEVLLAPVNVSGGNQPIGCYYTKRIVLFHFLDLEIFN
ncbi:hypothetical protein CDL12_01510 [Handroanthus impetiginosus]|uniref:Uncharacterized protein n=1 Tax=Handroanthus impetiginosus TaxID=429701 RepID=A0A2G9I7J3_9LAMI|nr:hypothetical protein CDL12_01510 [Handroanthus impetiginosus]